MVHSALPDTFLLQQHGKTLLAVRKDWPELGPLLTRGAAAALATGDATPLPGRGTCALLSLPGRGGPRVILKRYSRGGIFGRLLGETMVGTSRPLEEIAVAEALRTRGVSVPEILGCKLERVLPGLYRGEIALREIPGTRTLYHALAGVDGTRPAPPTIRRILATVARALRAFHDAGAYHADLHARNILLSGNLLESPTVHWIDLEKSTVGPPLDAASRMRNLIRLHRSVEKLSRLRDAVGIRDRLRFLRHYFAPQIPTRAEVRAIVSACRRNVARHRLWWRLTGESRIARVERNAAPMRILVKGVNWLGDAVMSLPAIDWLHERYPQAHVSVLTLANLADVYAGRTSVQTVIPYRKQGGLAGIRQWFALVADLRARHLDLAVLLPGSFHSALTVWWAGIPQRRGHARELRGWMLTDRVPRRPPHEDAHRVTDYLRLAAHPAPPPCDRGPNLPVDPEDLAWVDDTVRAAGLDPAAQPLIAINPGATYGGAKCWPAERFVALGQRLIAEAHASLVVVGGPAEQALGEQIAGRWPKAHAICLAGKTSIRRLAALLSRCRLLVTNDTGPMHVAQAVGTRIVAIFGPTDPINTPPWGNRHVIVREPVACSPCFLRECPIDHRCMDRVQVDDVFHAAERLIAAVPSGSNV